MYQTIIFYHSIIRWLVLTSLLYSIFRAGKGYLSNAPFSKTDNTVRHWTATIAHIQLVIGITLYTQSPIIKYFWHNFNQAIQNLDTTFFGLLHIILMLTAIIFITIGSALSKRKTTDKEKFKTILIWYSISIIIIFIAIPWPFSPLANRPYFR
ncbi:magnesium-transporting ATPase (P-type) [Pedobacter sp. UYEF25]